MRNFSDRNHAAAAPERKRLGGYLIEAGLLTPAQVDVALNDQKLTGMRFGEILAARGWVKQQTIEYLMHKVVLPEQQPSRPRQRHSLAVKQNAIAEQPKMLVEPRDSAVSDSAVIPDSSPTNDSRQPTRRDGPIAKPLPSVNSVDGDISWVG